MYSNLQPKNVVDETFVAGTNSPEYSTAQADGERKRGRFHNKHIIILSGGKCHSRRRFPDSYPSMVLGLADVSPSSWSQIFDGGVRHDEIKFTGRRGSSLLEN